MQLLTVVKFTTQWTVALTMKIWMHFSIYHWKSIQSSNSLWFAALSNSDANYWDASWSLLLVLLRAFLADGIPLKTPELLTDVISLFALLVSLHFIRFQTVSCQSPEAQHTRTSSVVSNHGHHESRMEICFVILDIGGPSSANIVCWDLFFSSLILIRGLVGLSHQS